MPPLSRRGSGGAHRGYCGEVRRDLVIRREAVGRALHLSRRHRDPPGQERHTQRRWLRLLPMVSTFAVLAALFFLVFYQIFKK